MKTLSFAGKNLSEFGVWFDSVRKYKKPAKRFTGFDIPARNGTLYQSNKKFDNVIIEYNCYIKDNFATNYNDLVNYLNSFDGYQILENSTDNTVYRMAVFHEEIAPNMEQFLKSGQFTLFFDCMPQEFLKTGDNEVTITTTTLTNPTLMASKPIFKFQGNGKVMMNGNTVITIPNPVRITVSDPVIMSGVTFTFSNVVDINGLASADIEYLVGHLYLTVGTYTLNATVTGSGTVNCKCDGSTFTGNKTIVVTETGWIPIYAVIANGTTVNATMTLTLTMDDIIVDCERMDSYFVSGGQANEIVKLTDGFIEIPKGTTTLSADGTVTVKPKWWRL